MSTERETVTRYDLVGHDEYCTMQPYEEGDYVLFADYDAQRERIRTATQLIIAEIGASGPEDLESALGRLIGRHQGFTAQREADRVAIERLEQRITSAALDCECMRQERDDAVDAREGAYIRVDGLRVEIRALQQRCEALERERDEEKEKLNVIENDLSDCGFEDVPKLLEDRDRKMVTIEEQAEQLAAAQQRVARLDGREKTLELLEQDHALTIQQLQQAQQQATGLREALEWIINLHHGVSRFAGDGFHHGVMPVEWQDAIKAGRQALAPQQAQRVVGGEEAANG